MWIDVAGMLLLAGGMNRTNGNREADLIDYEDESGINEGYIFGTPTNGKLVHDMRTFENVTFDWSSRLYGKEASIPLCHEWRIRRSYFGFNLPEPRVEMTMEQSTEDGQLVYPLTISVCNSTEDRIYFAAVIHKTGKEKKKTEILLVPEGTWKRIWDTWTSANSFPQMDDERHPRMSHRGANSTELCTGGSFFDDILPQIYNDSKSMPKYSDIINVNYSDLITDACDSTRCNFPQKEMETLTFAYPTVEGLQELSASLYFEDDGKSTIAQQARYASDMQMSRMIRAAYDREMFARFKGLYTYKEDSLTDAQIKANHRVFYPPYY